jgi:hypothetical protein
MPAQTFSARAVAAIVSKRVGRAVSDKQVRAYVRDTMAAYQDDAYTHHAYSAKQRDAIVNGMVARRRPGATGTNGRAAAASSGRTPAKRTTRAKSAKGTATPATPATGTPDAAGGTPSA